jgi:hypothetical protein
MQVARILQLEYYTSDANYCSLVQQRQYRMHHYLFCSQPQCHIYLAQFVFRSKWFSSNLISNYQFEDTFSRSRRVCNLLLSGSVLF